MSDHGGIATAERPLVAEPDALRRVPDAVAVARADTPYLVFDPRIAVRRYAHLCAMFAGADVHYAVKANPQPELLHRLAAHGASFDVASRAEVDLCLGQGASPGDISYGNTIKKVSDIRHAYARGVRLFVFDSEAELHKLAVHAPGARVLCRLLVDGEGARWPLGHKFGCSPEMAAALLIRAARIGLEPIGVSFHVGSQQVDPLRWEAGIALAARVFSAVAAAGLALTTLNVGGGFPVTYRSPVPAIEVYAAVVEQAMRTHFGATRPRLAVEPGRYVAAPAGLLRAEVVLVSRKGDDDDARWVYLDVGRFSGLAETEGEAIQYQLRTDRDGGPTGPVRLAGPTCDSADILYRHTPYRLPLALRAGDHVDILAAGAYTATYSSVGFNGFPPLSTICIGDDE